MEHGQEKGKDNPPKKSPRKLEHAYQSAFFDWVKLMRARYPEMENIYAIPNGAHLAGGAFTYRKLEKEGVKPGVLDVNIDIPRGKYHGARLEFKVPPNKPTPEQAKQAHLNATLGYQCYLCPDAEYAIKATCQYLEIENPFKGA